MPERLGFEQDGVDLMRRKLTLFGIPILGLLASGCDLKSPEEMERIESERAAAAQKAREALQLQSEIEQRRAFWTEEILRQPLEGNNPIRYIADVRPGGLYGCEGAKQKAFAHISPERPAFTVCLTVPGELYLIIDTSGNGNDVTFRAPLNAVWPDFREMALDRDENIHRYRDNDDRRTMTGKFRFLDVHRKSVRWIYKGTIDVPDYVKKDDAKWRLGGYGISKYIKKSIHGSVAFEFVLSDLPSLP